MQSIERAAAFKKDFKRVKATPKHAKYIDGLLENVLELLITNQRRIITKIIISLVTGWDIVSVTSNQIFS